MNSADYKKKIHYAGPNYMKMTYCGIYLFDENGNRNKIRSSPIVREVTCKRCRRKIIFFDH
jgi:hypothetical protein